MGLRGPLAFATVTALVVCSLDARAQQPGDPAAAQSLFDEGKRLMQEKNFAAACPKLAESQRLDPAGGTILALALCHEGEGKTATAWAEFNQALGDARRDKRADREAAASDHIKALEPRLARLRVVVNKPVDGLVVKRDGLVVGSAQWGTALAIDPGAHAFEVTAPNKQRWTSTVTVDQEGRTLDVIVPALADAPSAAAPPPPATPPPDREPVREGSSSQRTWGLVIGGVGVVAAGVGAGFGLSASSKWKDAEKACPGNVCPNSAATQAGKDAGTAADVSTALFVLGGIALAGGAVLYLTAPKADEARVRVTPWAGPSGGGAMIGGTL